jgi:hypothetical protein
MRRVMLPIVLAGCLGGACPLAAEEYLHFYAAQVVDYSPGPGTAPFDDPLSALDGPGGYGSSDGSLEVVTLGLQGSITLGFDRDGQSLVIADGPGADFIVFENAFSMTGTGLTFAELIRVQVSSDGTHFAEFPVSCDVPGPVGPYEALDAGRVRGFAGVTPVRADVLNPDNPYDPYDPAAAGGDAFDLADLHPDELVRSGVVRLDRIRHVRLVDVRGDGSEMDCSDPPHPIYDPFGVMDPDYGLEPLSADVDAVAVVHGAPAPPERLIGDADEDGDVDFLDYARLKRHYGTPAAASWGDGDFNLDGRVDLDDYAAAEANFGRRLSGAGAAGAAGPAAAPEPGALALLAAGAAGLLRRRKHAR